MATTENIELPLEHIHRALQKLIGLHRQLLDTVRAERAALVSAEIKSIEEATYAKQALIESIRQAEAERLKALAELALLWKRPARDLVLTELAIAVQARAPKFAEQLRTAFNTLTVLVRRAAEQNDDNRALVDRSLEHIHEMKRNVLSESTPKAETYTQQGKRAGGPGGARIISKEA